MSPEILVQGENKFQASLQHLMLSDIWSLGMTLFTMINPSLKCPYLLEIRSTTENIVSQADVQNFVGNLLRKKKLPLSDDKYKSNRATVWSSLEEAYIGCTNFDPTKRFSLRDIEEVLCGRYDVSKNCDIIKLKVTQSTAIEKNDHHVASKCSRGNQIQSPVPVNVTNDGTNACAFLSVKIADRVINNFDGNASDTTTLAEMIEEVIWFLPEEINAKRNLATFYDVLETYALLSKEKLLNSKYDFFEELPFGDCIYSFEVRKQLHEKLCVLGQNDFSAIFSSVPYILVIGCAAGRAFVIDTHTGSLIVGRNNAPLTWKSLCIWLWDRLLCAGVKEGTGQSLSILKPWER